MTRPAKAPSVDELKESLRQVEQKKAAKQEGKGSITTLSVLPGVQDELQENLLPQEPLEARPVKAAKQELDELDELLQQAELLQQVPPLLPENAVVSNLPVVGFEESWLPPNALYGCVERRGDCFFESIGQQLTALKIAHPAGLPLGQYIRSVVAEFWLQKTSDDRESDFGAIKCDATLMLDTSVVSVEEFIRWIRLTSDFVRQTLDSHSQNPAGHQQPAKNPYWGGGDGPRGAIIFDSFHQFQEFSNDITQQGIIWKYPTITVHVVQKSGVTVFGKGFLHVWIAGNGEHWLPVWSKKPGNFTTVQFYCNNTTVTVYY